MDGHSGGRATLLQRDARFSSQRSPSFAILFALATDPLLRRPEAAMPNDEGMVRAYVRAMRGWRATVTRRPRSKPLHLHTHYETERQAWVRSPLQAASMP